MKIVMKWLGRITSVALYGILLCIIILVVYSKIQGGTPQILGHQILTVLSGSMEPGIKTGSLIAVKPVTQVDSLKKGDVITFKSLDNPNVLITHRIVKVEKADSQINYITKGDNNDGNDTKPIPSSNVVAKYSGFTIPYIGYLFDFFHTKTGKIVLLIIPGILLLGYSLIKMWKIIASIDDDQGKQTLEKPKSV
ncbi:signal peptidase I SipW [Neobacillus sp. SCS-31]|uniref:signal peptidase I SipW n=1 Tax=Neobacillus oceani TaxID=3115292 RepID=UPI003906CD98